MAQGNASAAAQPKQEETLFSRVTIPLVAVEHLWELYTAKKKDGGRKDAEEGERQKLIKQKDRNFSPTCFSVI